MSSDGRPDGPGGWLRAALVMLALRLVGRRRREPEPPRDPREDVPGQPPTTAELELPSTARWERVVLLALLVAVLGAVAFVVLYAAVPDTQLLGLAMGLALVALAVAAIAAGKRLVPQEKALDEYHEFGDPDEQAEVGDIVRHGGRGISRRRLLIGAAGAATASVGAAAAAVPVASLGPRVDDVLDETPWRYGRRVVDADGRPLTVDDVPLGEFRTGFPEGATQRELGAPVIIVRLPPDQIDVSPRRKAAMPEGVMAYSKICPHAGCAISMYRYPAYEPDVQGDDPALVCPCHYSTFAVRTGGQLVFGPAGRALPQLPLRLGGSGELVAAGGFLDGVGPSWGGVREAKDRS
jgi:ubiquinol-cytochrome c reductase iron-sulfur subunit